MTKAKNGEGKSTSELIQFRWNHKDELMHTAWETIKEYKKDPHYESLGQFFAEAVLAFRGRSLPNRSTIAKLAAKIDRVIENQNEMGNMLISAIQNGGLDLSNYVNPANGHSLQDDLGEQIPQNVYEEMFSGVQGKTFDVD